MAITFLAPGCSATGDLSQWRLIQSSVDANSSNIIHNPYSLRVFGGAGSCAGPLGTMANAGGRWSFYFKPISLPGFTEAIAFGADSIDNTTPLGIQLTAAGTFNVLWPNAVGGFWSATSTASVAAGGSCRICVAWVYTNSSSWTVKLFINGNLEATLSNSLNGISTVSSAVNNPHFQTNAGGSVSYCYDDIYLDDATSLTDTGDVRVTAKKPNANGASNAFDTNIGANPANRWENVDDRPVGLTPGWKQAGTSQVTEQYGIESVSQGDVDITGGTVLGHCGWIYARSRDPSVRAYAIGAGSQFKGTGTTNACANSNRGGIGDIAIVFSADLTAAVATIADDKGHTWTSLQDGTNTIRLKAWYTIIVDPTFTATVTYSNANVAKAAILVIVTGCVESSPLDKNPAALNDSTSPYNPNATGTMAQADEVVVCYGAMNGTSVDTTAVGASDTAMNAVGALLTGTSGAGATSNVTLAGCYRVVASTGTVTPQFTNSSANRTGIVGVATFKRWTPTGAGTAKLQYNGVDSSVTFTGASQFFITTFTVSGTYPASAPVIGMKSTGSGAVSVLYDCGVIVAYIPGAAPFLPQPPFIKQQAVQRAAFN